MNKEKITKKLKTLTKKIEIKKTQILNLNKMKNCVDSLAVSTYKYEVIITDRIKSIIINIVESDFKAELEELEKEFEEL